MLGFQAVDGILGEDLVACFGEFSLLFDGIREQLFLYVWEVLKTLFEVCLGERVHLKDINSSGGTVSSHARKDIGLTEIFSLSEGCERKAIFSINLDSTRVDEVHTIGQIMILKDDIGSSIVADFPELSYHGPSERVFRLVLEEIELLHQLAELVIEDLFLQRWWQLIDHAVSFDFGGDFTEVVLQKRFDSLVELGFQLRIGGKNIQGLDFELQIFFLSIGSRDHGGERTDDHSVI